MVFDVFEFTPFGMSILPTPKLILSISQTNTTTTTAAPKIRKDIVDDDSKVAVPTTTTTTTSKISNKLPDKSSNLNNVVHTDVAAADVPAADDDINNAKLPLGCENSIGDFNGTQNDYYQLTQNYGSNIPCINSIMPNDGEILSLPLSSPVYRVEQAKIDNPVYRVEHSDDTDNEKSPLIGDLDGIKDKYYQVKGKYGSIYDRSDDINPPPLHPESPAYPMNIPCIHSSIPNDGERIVVSGSVS